MIEITPRLSIPRDELVFTASRSSGPGGQHVNKTSSRITLRFDLEASTRLSEAQKATLRARLATRLTKDGVLMVHAQKHRSQSRNRERAVERFAELLRDALAEAAPRRPNRIPRGVRRRRLDNKRRRSQTKAMRRAPSSDE